MLAAPHPLRGPRRRAAAMPRASTLMAGVALFVAGVVTVLLWQSQHGAPAPRVDRPRVAEPSAEPSPPQHGATFAPPRRPPPDAAAQMRAAPDRSPPRTLTLSPAQQATALERVRRGRDGSAARLRQTGVETPAAHRASLDEEYVVVVYDAMLAAIADGSALLFRAGSEDFEPAWRAVPRGWRKTSMRNVASLDDGTTIDMIVAVDPAANAALRSVVERREALAADVPRGAAAAGGGAPK